MSLDFLSVISRADHVAITSKSVAIASKSALIALKKTSTKLLVSYEDRPNPLEQAEQRKTKRDGVNNCLSVCCLLFCKNEDERERIFQGGERPFCFVFLGVQKYKSPARCGG
jgi:hypothetical protein